MHVNDMAAFFIGCFVYGIRSWIGRGLVGLLWMCLKRLLRLSEDEIKYFHEQRRLRRKDRHPAQKADA